jgi:hypothetical protein
MLTLKQGSRLLIALLTSASLLLPSLTQAQIVKNPPSGAEMVGDAIIVRPMLAVATAVGTAIFLVTLPFSALGNNTGEAAKTLVGTPARSLFIRCLGCTGEEMESREKQAQQHKAQQVTAPN